MEVNSSGDERQVADGNRPIPMARIIGIYADRLLGAVKAALLLFLTREQGVLVMCGVAMYRLGMSHWVISGILRTPKCKREKSVCIDHESTANGLESAD